MKKIIWFLFSLIFCISFAGCNDTKYCSKTAVFPPLKEINTVYDSDGNILQQTVYNEKTDEYTTNIFTYAYDNGIWVCTEQKSLITQGMKENTHVTDTSLNVYYNTNLTNEPIVLIDNKDIKVSIIEYLDTAGWWEFGYKFKVENKSDKVLTISFDCVSIMDINCKPMFSIDHIDTKCTAYFNLAWDKASLERAWIPYIDNIGFMLRVFNNENWDMPSLYGTKVLIKK